MRGSPPSLLLAAALLASCERKDLVWRGDTTIAAEGIVVAVRPPLRAPGPTHEVCLLPKDDRLTGEWDSLYIPGESGIHPNIHLVRLDGLRDRLGFDADTQLGVVAPSGMIVYPDTMVVASESERRVFVSPAMPPSVSTEGDEGLICIWGYKPHEPRRVYRAIEIRADRPLAIREVRWWSGQRMAWP
jgi:hypothetical protein